MVTWRIFHWTEEGGLHSRRKPGQSSVIRVRLWSTQTRCWNSSSRGQTSAGRRRSQCLRIFQLIVKRFRMLITASIIQRYLRMMLHWVTVRAKTGLQHWWDCASHLCDSFLSLHKLSSICQLCNVVEQRWRAKLVQHDQPTVPSKKNWLHTFK